MRTESGVGSNGTTTTSAARSTFSDSSEMPGGQSMNSTSYFSRRDALIISSRSVGRFLSLRTEEFVTAARLDGCSEGRIIFRHMMPSFLSHIIASVTLAIPAMILAETALSFLGLGLQPPTISWGVLLREAQNIRSIATAPWLFAPGAFVVVAVMALNLLGDGLRDAADPYNK